MEIDRSNYNELEASLMQKISESSFISVDLEFTGLYEPFSHTKMRLYDLPQERYKKMAIATKSFSVTQLGLCLSKWDAKEKKYICTPVSIPLFPRNSQNFNFYQRPFLSQPESLNFLAENKFDFNRWIYSGLSYLRSDNETNCLLRHMESSLNDYNYEPNLSQVIRDGINKVVKWVVENFDKSQIIDIQSHKAAKLIDEMITEKYHSIKSDINGTYLSLIANPEPLGEDDLCPVKNLKDLVGARHIIDHMIKCKVPLVVHNGLFDIMYIYCKFIAESPPTLEMFKTAISELFPLIFDTKHLFTNSGIELVERPSLQHIFSELSTEKYMFPDVVKSKEANINEVYHDAGYDSYCTAFIFLKLMGYMSSLKASTEIDFKSEEILANVSRIALCNSDIEYINLRGEDSVKPRDKLFVVYNLDPKAQEEDIRKVFKEDSIGHYELYWMNKTTCYMLVTEDKLQEAQKFCSMTPIKYDNGDVFCDFSRFDYYTSQDAANTEKETSLVEPPKKKKRED